ncbi:hypothetical protein RHGRI_000295 [Rhododendron griersonianum]|uniref:Uncharacterized protein n=1 Tax=Rhododendron griersonianum TaxID=479676 RepID=A0AAV6LG39_9ERIC|nr:hypothetical protein RHGRI_000295 [Rhododendron griersonianum]
MPVLIPHELALFQWHHGYSVYVHLRILRWLVILDGHLIHAPRSIELSTAIKLRFKRNFMFTYESTQIPSFSSAIAELLFIGWHCVAVINEVLLIKLHTDVSFDVILIPQYYISFAVLCNSVYSFFPLLLAVAFRLSYTFIICLLINWIAGIEARTLHQTNLNVSNKQAYICDDS